MTADEIDELAGKIRADTAAWNACPKHRFPRLPGNGPLSTRVRCEVCGVERMLVDVVEYVRGYAAAGGDPDDVLPGWRP